MANKQTNQSQSELFSCSGFFVFIFLELRRHMYRRVQLLHSTSFPHVQPQEAQGTMLLSSLRSRVGFIALNSLAFFRRFAPNFTLTF